MGKFINSLDKLLLSRPKVDDYLSMHIDEKDFIDEVVKNYVKSNPFLRTRRRFRIHNLEPKEMDFWNLTWNDIVMIRHGFSTNNMLDVFKCVYNINEKQFLKLEILNAFAVYKFMTEQMNKIEAAEHERLSSDMKEDDKEAGAEDLLEYGYYNSLRAVCPNLLEQKDYLKLPYSMIFRELAISKLISDINTNKQENAARKNKRNG